MSLNSKFRPGQETVSSTFGDVGCHENPRGNGGLSTMVAPLLPHITQPLPLTLMPQPDTNTDTDTDKNTNTNTNLPYPLPLSLDLLNFNFNTNTNPIYTSNTIFRTNIDLRQLPIICLYQPYKVLGCLRISNTTLVYALWILIPS